MHLRLYIAALLFAASLLGGGRAAAGQVISSTDRTPGEAAGQTPEAERRGAGLDEQLGEAVAADLTFYDEQGEAVRIGDYLGGERPVILTLVYYNCPMLCNLLLDGFTETLGEMEWTPGQEFDVVTVSFAADETPDVAVRAKAKHLKALGRPEAAEGWHFLTGEEVQIQGLAASVGFQFAWDEEQQQYAHPAALVFLSPEGTITRYLYGIGFDPGDTRQALVEASNGEVGTTLDRLLMYCFQFSPTENTYVLHASNLMKLGGLLTVVVLGTALFFFWRREAHRPDDEAVPA